ncbi:heavy metal-associated domain-containing protein [Roseburia hominis]
MGNVIVIAVLLVIAFFAVKSTMKHFKGEGGCCGGGCSECGNAKMKHKKLEGDKIAEKVIRIEGMHCEHCKHAVEEEINKIDGASAKVNLRKNLAVVSMDRRIADDELYAAVARAGFQVVE